MTTSDATEPPPDLSVLVASYNTRDLLLECLATLERNRGALRVETVVVDNSSSDGTPDAVAERFPHVTLVRNAVNEGFAKANNRALKLARGRYLLLLNPDTLIPPDVLAPMVALMEENKDVGLAGCRVDRPDGGLDAACKRSFPTPWNALGRFLGLDRLLPRLFGQYRRAADDPRGRYDVDAVVGAFMLVRRETVDDVGGLDEDFFMFGEDLDWCYRVKRKDWRVWYVGDRGVVHHKGASTRQDPHRMNWHFHRSMFLFHRKHLVDRYPFFVNWLVYLGITLRYAARALAAAVRPKAPRAALGPAEMARLETRYGLKLEAGARDDR
ncbi:MAG TPA: glycosyltransferase family 2 protein [Planctomycetota bacterium]|nr:glycosyltransferase family 2 protein [Planctomycetota bacterium]